jgi:asparagine synthetase B (glutamine-hydrolysing)
MAATAKALSDVVRRTLTSAADTIEAPCLALSGGIDSCAILAAMCDVGNAPDVYSYTPDTHESTDFQMARASTKTLGLHWTPVVVPMGFEYLDHMVRRVIAHGYRSKVQVESLVPMLAIADAVRGNGTLVTGDQSDGYFALSKWAAHNYDRSVGVPVGSRRRTFKGDPDPTGIDAVRVKYFNEDLSCSGAVGTFVNGEACFPYRDAALLEAFLGTTWDEVNLPRNKEPVRLAFERSEYASDITVRPTQVNLHKGDSRFGDTLTATMTAMYPGYASVRGLYKAIADGEV